MLRPLVLAAIVLAAQRLPVAAETLAVPAASDLRMVVIVSRHGVRSPTQPNELAAYSSRPWPAWEVAPGYLTPHGASAIEHSGAALRTLYASEGLFPRAGCPPPESVYVWADIDQRTKATGAALLAGFAPRCDLTVHDAGTASDPLFHALPALGKADPNASAASLAGSIGDSPQAIVPAYALAFSKLDAILGCATASCRPISSVTPSYAASAKTGLVELSGAVDLASTAVEDFILAYADGKPLAEIGWGEVDRQTLLEISQLHTLKFFVNTETSYNARVQGSNLLSHIGATIDQGATGTKNDRTRAPLPAKLVAFVGHDTNLEELAGMLHLRWLMPGYQSNDTPPGGALVFEVRRWAGAGSFVRVYFAAQTLDEMRTLSSAPPHRVPVLVPGCPALDCPIATFDRIVQSAIDPSFVGAW